MTYLEALRRVRARLIANEPGDSKYICDQLMYIGAKEYRQRISELIGHRFSYESWLEDFHPETFETMRALQLAGKDPFREGRIQWLDHLIATEEAA